MPLVVERVLGTPPAAAAEGTPAVVEKKAAAAAEPVGPDLGWVVAGYLLIIAGAGLGWVLWDQIDPGKFRPTTGFTIFAPLYVLAQGIERVIEPFSKFFGAAGTGKATNDEAKKERNEAFADLAEAVDPPDATKQAAATAQALVNRIRRNSAVFAWGLASFLGMVASGCFGILLLQAAGFDVPAFWDISLTGLAVGSGTKPLHDLISNMQKASSQRADPPAAVTAD
jgi:hypothetical protein